MEEAQAGLGIAFVPQRMEFRREVVEVKRHPMRLMGARRDLDQTRPFGELSRSAQTPLDR